MKHSDRVRTLCESELYLYTKDGVVKLCGGEKVALLACADAWDNEQWRPIEEYDAEKHGKWVLLAGKYNNTIRYVQEAHWSRHLGVWLGTHSVNLKTPTYFRALPAPPEEEA